MRWLFLGQQQSLVSLTSCRGRGGRISIPLPLGPRHNRHYCADWPWSALLSEGEHSRESFLEATSQELILGEKWMCVCSGGLCGRRNLRRNVRYSVGSKRPAWAPSQVTICSSVCSCTRLTLSQALYSLGNNNNNNVAAQ